MAVPQYDDLMNPTIQALKDLVVPGILEKLKILGGPDFESS